VLAGSCGSETPIPAGNVNNFGYVFADGNDIYYTQVVITDFSYYGNIYKYNTANKSEILVAETEVDYFDEMNAYLTLHNGELYFLPYFTHEYGDSSPNIYKVKPDGANTTPAKLFDKDISCTFMQIKDGVLYYYDDMESKLYSMNPNGTNRKVICEADMQSISIGGSKAYFADDEMLMSVSLKGGEPEVLFDFWELDDGFYLENIVADGNYIYYYDEFNELIGRIRTNGRDNQEIYAAESGEYIVSFNVSGDTVYIVAGNYGAERNYALLAVSGGDARVIVSDSEKLIDIMPVSIWGETLYFNGAHLEETVDGSDYAWFTVRRTGGNLVPWRAFSIYDEDYGAEEDWGGEDWDDEDWDDDWD
jgi:hypothetical protein